LLMTQHRKSRLLLNGQKTKKTLKSPFMKTESFALPTPKRLIVKKGEISMRTKRYEMKHNADIVFVAYLNEDNEECIEAVLLDSERLAYLISIGGEIIPEFN